MKGGFKARVKLSDLNEPNSVTLSGDLNGPLGSSRGSGHINLTVTGASTEVSYDYAVEISGKVASIGGRMLDRATNLVIGQFFKRLTANFEGPGESTGATDGETGGEKGQSLWQWLLRLIGAGN